jgi:hypothetical protein
MVSIFKDEDKAEQETSVKANDYIMLYPRRYTLQRKKVFPMCFLK